ncbi:MAG: hypothetical protein KatS3mg002_1232 [Candidatus Woesearchaeota archaeon]|nr:MAG: hypothetical protein KatS3mg002_1232 [Candidatus Woesearchaeota archaeon]
MPEYDVDLKTLEDMCSELSEVCFLVNKDFKIVWHNQSYTAFPSNKNVFSEFFEKHLPLIFNDGKLINVSLKNGLKIMGIPVRYDDKIVSVLCILENSVNNPIINYFLENVKTPSLILDKNLNYIGHNLLMEKEFKNAPLIKEILLEKIINKSFNSKDLKNSKELLKLVNSILGMSHNVIIKNLKLKNNTVGFIISLRRKFFSKNDFRKSNKK